jgi:hypothetical protein
MTLYALISLIWLKYVQSLYALKYLIWLKQKQIGLALNALHKTILTLYALTYHPDSYRDGFKNMVT